MKKVIFFVNFVLILIATLLLPLLLFRGISAENSSKNQITQLNCKVSEISLPIVFNDYFSGNVEIEPNNFVTETTGPILSGIVYSGTYTEPRNLDVKDFYRFYNATSGNITVQLKGVPPVTDVELQTRQTQLLLAYRYDDYLATVPSPMSTVVAKDIPPYDVTFYGEEGWYVILVHAPSNTSPYINYELLWFSLNQT